MVNSKFQQLQWDITSPVHHGTQLKLNNHKIFFFILIKVSSSTSLKNKSNSWCTWNQAELRSYNLTARC